jgi:hypothetical protein
LPLPPSLPQIFRATIFRLLFQLNPRIELVAITATLFSFILPLDLRFVADMMDHKLDKILERMTAEYDPNGEGER